MDNWIHKTVEEAKAVAVQNALENLKRNADYQYLCTELESIKDLLDYNIFNEDIEHERKVFFIAKRNAVQNFIDLPSDLLAAYWIKNEEKSPID